MASPGTLKGSLHVPRWIPAGWWSGSRPESWVSRAAPFVLDLLNCSVLSWLYVRRHGLELSSPAPATAQKQPVGEPLPTAADGGPEAAPAVPPSVPEPQARPAQVPNTSTTATPPTTSAPTPFDPTGVFCDRPRSRIDAAVSQGLSILAGLTGGSGVGGGKGDQP